jgi:hypothetical protein
VGQSRQSTISTLTMHKPARDVTKLGTNLS